MNERFEIIEIYLLWKGSVQRSDLSRHFDIGSVTASRVMQAYAEKNPDNMVYSPSRKAYVYSSRFKSTTLQFSDKALSLLAYGTHTRTLDEHTCGPNIAPSIAPELKSLVASAVTRSIFLNEGIDIRYISASSGESDRVVFPHAIFKAGNNWYFRAFDRLKHEFRTFRFNRIHDVKTVTVSQSEFEERKYDLEWCDEVTLSLAPHPQHPNPEALVFDLGLTDQPVKNVRLNKVTAPFVLQDMHVDCSPKGNMDSQTYYLRLMNHKEFDGEAFMTWAPGNS